MTLDIDILIVIAFLLTNLIFGMFFGKKVTTMEDFALGGRNFSTGALVATIVATSATGSSFYVAVNKTYSDGLPFMLAGWFSTLQFIVIGLYLIPKMSRFMGSLSIAEVMGTLYGKEARFITAVSAIIWNIGFIAVQFKVFGNVFVKFLNIPEHVGIIASSCFVILYSSVGGVRAVTRTDIVQFFTFGFVIPMIGIVIWNHFQANNLSVANSFSNPLFTLASFKRMDVLEATNFILLVLYFSTPALGPIDFQRISMGRNTAQVQKAFLISGGIFLTIELATEWIPFLIKSIDPDIPSNQIVNYVIDNFAFTGFKGMVLIGICALAMSSADSFINGSAVLFGHDLKQVFNINVNRLKLSKIFSVILGTISIYLALSTDDLLKMVMSTGSLYISMVTPGLIFAILGFKTTKKSALIGMAAGFATIVVFKLFAFPVDEIIPGMVINSIFLFGSHYVLKQPGGWYKVEVEATPISVVNKGLFLAVNPLTSLSKFNLGQYLKKYTPTNDLSYVGVGIYYIIYSFTTMYSTNFELSTPNGKTVLAIYQIMMVTGVIMATYPIWPLSIAQAAKESFVKVWWYASIFYMLIFFSSFFAMVSDFGSLQFAVFTANLLIAINLIGWRLSLPVIPIGFFLSIEFFKFHKGIDSVDFSIGSPLFVLVYTLFLVGTVLAIFLKPKQDLLEEKEEQVNVLTDENKFLDQKVDHFKERIKHQEQEIARLGATARKILNNVNHELRLPVGNVMNFAEMLNAGLEKFNTDQLKELSEEVYKNSNRLSTMILNMLDLATLDIKKVNLQKSTVNLSELVRDRVQNCRKIYLDNKPLDFELYIEPEILAYVDANYIRQTVDNLIINSINYSKEGTIKISLKKEPKFIKFVIEDEGIGIPKENIYDIFEPFTTSNKTISNAEGRGVGLSLCKSAVEAHDGNIKAEPKEYGAKFIFILPIG